MWKVNMFWDSVFGLAVSGTIIIDDG
jgi:hypothetical protein